MATKKRTCDGCGVKKCVGNYNGDIEAKHPDLEHIRKMLLNAIVPYCPEKKVSQVTLDAAVFHDALEKIRKLK